MLEREISYQSMKLKFDREFDDGGDSFFGDSDVVWFLDHAVERPKCFFKALCGIEQWLEKNLFFFQRNHFLHQRGRRRAHFGATLVVEIELHRFRVLFPSGSVRDDLPRFLIPGLERREFPLNINSAKLGSPNKLTSSFSQVARAFSVSSPSKATFSRSRTVQAKNTEIVRHLRKKSGQEAEKKLRVCPYD